MIFCCILWQMQKKNYRSQKKQVARELLTTLSDPSVIILADWLKIRGSLKSWTKLWCVLKPGLLILYKSEKQKVIELYFCFCSQNIPDCFHHYSMKFFTFACNIKHNVLQLCVTTCCLRIYEFWVYGEKFASWVRLYEEHGTLGKSSTSSSDDPKPTEWIR